MALSLEKMHSGNDSSDCKGPVCSGHSKRQGERGELTKQGRRKQGLAQRGCPKCQAESTSPASSHSQIIPRGKNCYCYSHLTYEEADT